MRLVAVPQGDFVRLILSLPPTSTHNTAGCLNRPALYWVDVLGGRTGQEACFLVFLPGFPGLLDGQALVTMAVIEDLPRQKFLDRHIVDA